MAEQWGFAIGLYPAKMTRFVARRWWEHNMNNIVTAYELCHCYYHAGPLDADCPHSLTVALSVHVYVSVCLLALILNVGFYRSISLFGMISKLLSRYSA